MEETPIDLAADSICNFFKKIGDFFKKIKKKIIQEVEIFKEIKEELGKIK